MEGLYNILTHIFISSSIRRYTYRLTGRRLSLTGFAYGNILPDIQVGIDRRPHYYKDSFEFVIARALDLCYDTGADIPCTSFEYSKRAGVIMHYISDYFCYAHSQRYKDNILRHHIYEFLMVFTFSKGLKAFKSCDNDGLRNIPPLNLETCLRSAIKKYDGDEHFKYKDISCALSVCAAAAAGLMQTSIFLDENLSGAQSSGLYGNLQY